MIDYFTIGEKIVNESKISLSKLKIPYLTIRVSSDNETKKENNSSK